MSEHPGDAQLAAIILSNGPDMNDDEVKHRRQHATAMDDLKAMVRMARLCAYAHINSQGRMRAAHKPKGNEDGG